MIDQIELYPHQKRALNKARSNNFCLGIFHEPGLGKTILSLKIYSEIKKIKPSVKMVIFCPKSIINSVWVATIKEIFPKLIVIKDITRVRGGKIPYFFDILVINYEKIVSNRYFEMIKDILNECTDVLCVLDESSRIKNIKSITTKRILSLKPYAEYRVVLSGTPSPNTILELYPQITFINDNILGGSYYKFRNNYASLHRGNYVIKNIAGLNILEMMKNGWDMRVSEENCANLLEKIDCVTDFQNKKIINLPGKNKKIVYVCQSTEFYRLYRIAERDFIVTIEENNVGIPNQMSKMTKLRQICSGFIYKNEQDKEIIMIKDNRKIASFNEIVVEIGEKQAVVWVTFNAEYDLISEALSSLNKTFCVLRESSGVSYGDIISDFSKNKFQFLIANPSVGGHGHNFVFCHIGIYFSFDYSFEKHSQSIDRFHRMGQENPCVYYYLVCLNTIEEDILDSLENKKTMVDFIHHVSDRIKSSSYYDNRETNRS